jgi:hypothetical protein
LTTNTISIAMLRKKEKRFICVNCLKAKGTKRKLFYRIRLFVGASPNVVIARSEEPAFAFGRQAQIVMIQ